MPKTFIYPGQAEGKPLAPPLSSANKARYLSLLTPVPVSMSRRRLWWGGGEGSTTLVVSLGRHPTAMRVCCNRMEAAMECPSACVSRPRKPQNGGGPCPTMLQSSIAHHGYHCTFNQLISSRHGKIPQPACRPCQPAQPASATVIPRNDAARRRMQRRFRRSRLGGKGGPMGRIAKCRSAECPGEACPSRGRRKKQRIEGREKGEKGRCARVAPGGRRRRPQAWS